MSWETSARQLGGHGVGDLVHDLLVIVRSERGPERPLVRRPQDDLGPLGAEGLQ